MVSSDLAQQGVVSLLVQSSLSVDGSISCGIMHALQGHVVAAKDTKIGWCNRLKQKKRILHMHSSSHIVKQLAMFRV